MTSVKSLLHTSFPLSQATISLWTQVKIKASPDRWCHPWDWSLMRTPCTWNQWGAGMPMIQKAYCGFISDLQSVKRATEQKNRPTLGWMEEWRQTDILVKLHWEHNVPDCAALMGGLAVRTSCKQNHSRLACGLLEQQYIWIAHDKKLKWSGMHLAPITMTQNECKKLRHQSWVSDNVLK